MAGRWGHLSLDDNIDYYSSLAAEQGDWSEGGGTMHDTMSADMNFDILLDNIKHLSKIDSTFVILSYMYKMSQKTIAEFLKEIIDGDISQVGVSVRLRRALQKLKFIIEAPSLDFVKIRTDFIQLFPENIRYIAFYFYFNHTQSRSRHFLNITQCTAATELDKVLNYLNKQKTTKDMEIRCLVENYLEFFNTIRKSSSINNQFFRNDFERNSKLIEAKSLIE